jgi:hypothetical protein
LEQLLILLIYPAGMSIPINPAAFRWSRKHPQPMRQIPPAMVDEFEDRGRWYLFANFCIVGALLFLWMRKYKFSPAQLGVSSNRLAMTFATGLIAGGFLIFGRMIVQRLIPGIRLGLSNHPFCRGPAWVWLFTFIVNGIVEEAWRAFALMAMYAADWNMPLAVIFISIASVVASRFGLPTRIPGIYQEESWLFVVSVFLAVLFLTFRNALVPYVASVAFNASILFLIRRTIPP